MAYEIEVYETDLGKKPFDDWLKELSDAQARHIIRARLVRARAGNLGNCKTLGNGINEMKIDFGPGYRIYFAKPVKPWSFLCVEVLSEHKLKTYKKLLLI